MEIENKLKTVFYFFTKACAIVLKMVKIATAIAKMAIPCIS